LAPFLPFFPSYCTVGGQLWDCAGTLVRREHDTKDIHLPAAKAGLLFAKAACSENTAPALWFLACVKISYDRHALPGPTADGLYFVSWAEREREQSETGGANASIEQPSSGLRAIVRKADARSNVEVCKATQNRAGKSRVEQLGVNTKSKK
jgi:hypothetical protein